MSIFREHPDLLPRFRRGERAALTAVYWRYVDAVTAMVRCSGLLSQRSCGARSEEIADLVQETFLRAFSVNARQSYDGVREYRPFLLRICRNLLVDVARRRGRELPSAGDLLAGELEPAEVPVLATEEVELVEHYVRDLPADLRAVYEQRYVLGRSQEQTAAALGLSRQTVRTREDRLRRGLRRRLQNQQRPPFWLRWRRTAEI